jgi:hypothetical protein
MRRAITVISLLTVAMALTADAASAQTAGQDSLVGSGQVGNFAIVVDVSSGPSGESPTGQLVTHLIDDGTLFFGGPPTCLSVDGNVATVNIRDELGVGFGIVTVQITDAAVDIFESNLFRDPSDCSPLTNPIVSGPVQSGDFVVTDARPLPTSKDQCKNGGWKTFGVFKNQGNCVSFVATGGKNPPGNASG